jgi:hypothetical protein
MPEVPKIVERAFSTNDLISYRQLRSFGANYHFFA